MKQQSWAAGSVSRTEKGISMKRSTVFSLCLMAGWVAGSSPVAWGQTEAKSALREQLTAAPSSIQMPFAQTPGRAVRLVPAEQMTEADRALAAAQEASLAQSPMGVLMEFDQGAWSYRKVDCAALPDYLLLRYERAEGLGSVFTVSIARTGGPVKVIPVKRNGRPMHKPAAENAQTIADFNTMVAQEKGASQAGWLEIAECYAALAGGNPTRVPAGPAVPAGPQAKLVMEDTGAMTVQFAEMEAVPPMLWRLSFDAHGKLLKVAQERLLALKVEPFGASK
jgi:hypothetical protein